MSDDWQVVEKALRGYGRGVDRLLDLDALARLREREALSTHEDDLEHQSERRAYWRTRAEAAEARVAELEREQTIYDGAEIGLRRRIAELEEALERIATFASPSLGASDEAEIARRALAHEEEKAIPGTGQEGC